MPNPTGPYLAVAVFCEKVLQEKDGVLSAIRMVDRVYVRAQGPEAPESLPPGLVRLTLLLAFKAGSATGSHSVKVRPETPAGLRLPEIILPVFFEGQDRGANLVMPLTMQVTQEGLYWFDVFIEEEFFTRIPLRVVYQHLSIGTSSRLE